MKVVKIKMLRDTVANSEVVSKGDVVSVPEKDARFLCNIGKAVMYQAPAKKKT